MDLNEHTQNLNPKHSPMQVHALDLSNMTWRSVKPKGSPQDVLPPSAVYSSAVWQSFICCLGPGPSIHLFDMETETWSKRPAPWPRCGVLYRAEVRAGRGRFRSAAISWESVFLCLAVTRN